tara:strand:- start:2025 stop:2159 length:135 start_codon:yes stop_codon:yes gene_type:complete
MERTIDNKIDQWFEDRGIVANGKTMSQAIFILNFSLLNEYYTII